MEKKERFVIEVLLGAILVVFLVLLVFLVTTVSSGQKTTVTDSYNKNTFNVPSTRTVSGSTQYGKPYIVDRGFYSDVYFVDRDLRHTDSRHNYLRYDARAHRGTTRGIFGNYIDDYSVHVRNREHAGGYFTVKFHFEDYYGRKETKVVRHYVRPHEEQRFVFKDISLRDRDKEYRNWWYEVVSNTKVPTRVYYN